MSAQIDDGGPAYPIPSDGRTHGTESGMSLRDHFAGLAMQGLMTMCASGKQTLDGADDCAKLAYEQADALLAARKAQP